MAPECGVVLPPGRCLQQPVRDGRYCYYHEKVATGLIKPEEQRRARKAG